MELVSSSVAKITWQWSGHLIKIPFSGTVVSTIMMNVLTGKITEHTDRVDLHGSLVAQLVYIVQKRLWAQKQSAQQLKNKVRIHFCKPIVLAAFASMYSLINEPFLVLSNC